MDLTPILVELREPWLRKRRREATEREFMVVATKNERRKRTDGKDIFEGNHFRQNFGSALGIFLHRKGRRPLIVSIYVVSNE